MNCLDGFSWKEENNAWNYLNRLFDLGTLWRTATMVAQQGLGLRAHGRPWVRSRHRSNPRASRTHLDFAATVGLEVSDG